MRWPTALLFALGLSGPIAAYEHDPRLAHEYHLEGRDGVSIEVVVDVTGLEWPAWEEGVDTVFLELDVRARGGVPWIEASSGGDRLRQYLARGARGKRYLNLSRFAQGAIGAGDLVRLQGHRVRWSTGSARLVGFDNRSLEGARVLVLAPHPDDAEIAAFGVYSSTNADVVTVTAGDAGGWNFRRLFPETGTHFRVKGWIRTWDSITVPFFGGVLPGRARNLGYYDATLEALWEERPEPVGPPLAEIASADYFRGFNVQQAGLDGPMTSSWPSLVGDMEREIRTVQPDVIVAPHPFLDRHLDHQFTSIALIEALERGGCGSCELYLYTNHAIEEETHPLGARDGVAGVSPWYGDELEFQRLYSHPLDDESQYLKLVALEAMHDLRRFDLRERKSIGSMAKEVVVEAGRRMKRGAVPDTSYFRRAARPNELFFVMSVDEAAKMKRRFLEAKGDL